MSKSGVHHWLFCHFRGPFRIWVLRNLCGCKSFCIFEIVCERLQPLWKISQPIIRIGLVFLFFYFVWVFVEIGRSRFQKLSPFVALLIDLLKTHLLINGNLDDELLPESWNDKRDMSILQVIIFSSWSIVAFGRWPTHKNVGGLRKVFRAVGRLAFHRVIAQSRINQDREHIFVPPRIIARRHWLS